MRSGATASRSPPSISRRRAWSILARNWRCRAGELDIVARDGAELVFVEVKTRSSLAFGSPAEAVDRAKAARIRRLALRWLAAERDARSASTDRPVLVGAALRRGVRRPRRRRRPQVEHLRGAF